MVSKLLKTSLFDCKNVILITERFCWLRFQLLFMLF